MRKAVIFIIIFCLCLACISSQKYGKGQGIAGEVRWVEGNLMPTIGDSNMVEKQQGIPVLREVYIYPAVTNKEVISAGGQFYKIINADLVARIKTRDDGRFNIKLAPGTYSIFVKEKQGFFANTRDGDGYITPVTVHEGEFTEIKIMVNYKAYY